MALPRTTPAEVDVDPRAVADFITTVLASGQEIHSLMLLRHGKVFAEGWAAPWGPQHQQLLYSLSKTFCSAAVGIAVGDGAFGYDDTLVDIFPDQASDDLGPKARSIRIRDVLSMASGHTEDMISLVGGFRPSLRRDILGEFLRHEPEATPGETFCYNQICTWAAGRAVHERTGKDVLELLQQRVFPALGIERATWAQDSDGRSLGFSGLHLQTESIAGFIQLLVDDGVRDGQQVLAPEWVQRHRQKSVENNNVEGDADWQLGYGWQVWMGQHGYRGDGAFGQFGLVLQEQDMAVIITSIDRSMQAVLDAVWNVLLPGVGRPGDAAGQAELDRVLASLGVAPATGEAGGSWSGTDPNGAALELSEDGAGWTLAWAEHPTSQPIRVGHGTWVETEWRDGDLSMPVSASAGRTGSGHTVELAFPNGPHRATLVLPAGGAQASFEWFLQEPLGLNRPWQLAQRFAR